jgi:hypothetical protein
MAQCMQLRLTSCGHDRRSHLCVQRDLVADTVRPPEQIHLHQHRTWTRIASYSSKTYMSPRAGPFLCDQRPTFRSWRCCSRDVSSGLYL